jgi:uncharacterized repeat protein (TIGR03803 family)
MALRHGADRVLRLARAAPRAASRPWLWLAGGMVLATLPAGTAWGADATQFRYYFGHAEGDPRAAVTLAPRHMLYGTTYSKETAGFGTVFAFNRATGVETTLHAFNGTDGAFPMAGVTRGAHGMLYGVTANGGPDGPGGHGVLFKINPATGRFTRLYAFTGRKDGDDPLATLVADSTGTVFYGSTSTLSGPGTIFKFDSVTNTLTTLYHFTGHLDGAQMNNCPLAWDKTGTILYGTSDTAGQYHKGVLFAFDTTTNTLTPLHQFTGGVDGEGLANGVTVAANGVLYGTTSTGGLSDGTGEGTIYAYDTATNVFTTLYTFTGTAQGVSPTNAVAFGNDGHLYGATLSGGSGGGGTLYQFDPATAAIKVLFTFNATDGASGATPYGRLTFDGVRSFWGTTGAFQYNLGTLFQLTTR